MHYKLCILLLSSLCCCLNGKSVNIEDELSMVKKIFEPTSQDEQREMSELEQIIIDIAKLDSILDLTQGTNANLLRSQRSQGYFVINMLHRMLNVVSFDKVRS